MWNAEILLYSATTYSVENLKSIKSDGPSQSVLSDDRISEFSLPLEGSLTFSSESKIFTIAVSNVEYVILSKK